MRPQRAFSKWGAPHCLSACPGASHAVRRKWSAAIKTHFPPSLLSLLLSSSIHHHSSTNLQAIASFFGTALPTSLALHLCLLDLSTHIHT